MIIRPYQESDFKELVEVYQSAFAEPPWNEFMKCVSCEVEYSKEEAETPKETCKKCGELLKLTPYWSAKNIRDDLEFALSQPNQIVLVAKNKNGSTGFTWGYKLPFEKFPFLEGKVSEQSVYMDEIAVKGNKRQKGVGTALGREFLVKANEEGILEAILRTDERNSASMALFRKLGFSSIPDTSERGKVYDPKFPNRIYLRKALR